MLNGEILPQGRHVTPLDIIRYQHGTKAAGGHYKMDAAMYLNQDCVQAFMATADEIESSPHFAAAIVNGLNKMKYSVGREGTEMFLQTIDPTLTYKNCEQRLPEILQKERVATLRETAQVIKLQIALSEGKADVAQQVLNENPQLLYKPIKFLPTQGNSEVLSELIPLREAVASNVQFQDDLVEVFYSNYPDITKLSKADMKFYARFPLNEQTPQKIQELKDQFKASPSFAHQLMQRLPEEKRIPPQAQFLSDLYPADKPLGAVIAQAKNNNPIDEVWEGCKTNYERIELVHGLLERGTPEAKEGLAYIGYTPEWKQLPTAYITPTLDQAISDAQLDLLSNAPPTLQIDGDELNVNIVQGPEKDSSNLSSPARAPSSLLDSSTVSPISPDAGAPQQVSRGSLQLSGDLAKQVASLGSQASSAGLSPALPNVVLPAKDAVKGPLLNTDNMSEAAKKAAQAAGGELRGSLALSSPAGSNSAPPLHTKTGPTQPSAQPRR